MNLSICLNPSVDTLVWVDSLIPGESNRSSREEHFPGGKATHVAIALRELGIPVTLSGFWGGPTGQWIRSKCGEKDIAVHGVEVDDWNRSCLTFQSSNHFNNTELLGVGPVISKERADEYLEAYKEIVADVDSINISGSLPPGVSDSFYAKLISHAKNKGKITVLDCTGEPFLQALKQSPTAIHLNAQECSAASGLTTISEAITYFGEFIPWVCITDGHNGLYVAEESVSGIYHAVCEVSGNYSSVGSGDCATAGLTFAIQNRKTAEEAAAYAAACGGANLLNNELGAFRRLDFERLLKEVKVVKLS